MQFRIISVLLLMICALTYTVEAQKISPKKKRIAYKNLPKITKVDAEGLKKILKPNGKPLLVNFWATWCEPCKEEFPDLVKLSEEYKGKIDFITVSLDDVADINKAVPRFLAEMKANAIPAYLLKTEDESTLIGEISKEWQGGLPFTLLYSADGKISHALQGKFRYPKLKIELDKSLLVK
jgi:thiol-disulfide isomerase/thioredoxin